MSKTDEDLQEIELKLITGEVIHVFWEWRRYVYLQDYSGYRIPFFRYDSRKRIFVRRESIVAFEYFGAPYGKTE